VDTATHIAAVESENATLLDAARAGPLDISVPSCPGWTIAQLVEHMGGVHRRVIGYLDTGSRPRTQRPADDEDVLEWFADGAVRLVDRLARIPPDAVTASFVGDQPASFWPRRQAHEAAVHRWDAEAARGATRPIDARLAADGIDELLEVFVGRLLPADALSGGGETIHLHATDQDVDGEWLLTLTPQGVRWQRGHDRATVAARGAASDLLLLLWNRLPPDELEVFGDRRLLERWQQAIRVG
jgi:uncharacterized protein (TIGR03083 family)